LDEGVEVFRPVQALMISEEIGIIQGAEMLYNGDENWEFPPGATVKLQQRILSGETVWIAVQRM
jgi:hypothetical protein